MIALFGGTFNPIHNGHISLAREVMGEFKLDSVDFLPSYSPVHREQPETSPEIRRQMVELAIAPYPELKLNTCELEREGSSYAYDTLKSIHSSSPGQTLCWLMGADSFNGFPGWKNPEGILQLAHLIVCTRPEVELDLSVFPSHFLNPHESLADFSSGKIVFYAMQPNHCSATAIRQAIKSGRVPDECLAPSVLEFIRKQHLYE